MAMIKQAMPAAPARQAPAPASAPAGAADAKASPEDQEAYERVVMAGIKAIYDEKTHGAVMNMLKSGDPANAMAQTVATIMLQLDKQSGGRVPEIVILPAAVELLGEVARLATTAKLYPVDETTIAGAMQKLITTLCQKYGVDPARLRATIESIPREQIESVSAQAQQSGAAPAAAAPAAQQPGV